MVLSGEMKNYIALNEAVHNQRIVEVSLQIAKRVANGVRIVLIAGPSSVLVIMFFILTYFAEWQDNICFQVGRPT